MVYAWHLQARWIYKDTCIFHAEYIRERAASLSFQHRLYFLVKDNSPVKIVSLQVTLGYESSGGRQKADTTHLNKDQSINPLLNPYNEWSYISRSKSHHPYRCTYSLYPSYSPWVTFKPTACTLSIHSLTKVSTPCASHQLFPNPKFSPLFEMCMKRDICP